MVKETILPAGANKAVFILAPMLTFILALVAWAVIPFGEGLVIADINVGILYLFAISSLGVYGVIMAGWASNSKYAFLGALRSAAQMVSYEVSMGLVIINVLICVGSLNLSAIVEAQRDVWFALPLLPMFFVFFISTLAETGVIQSAEQLGTLLSSVVAWTSTLSIADPVQRSLGLAMKRAFMKDRKSTRLNSSHSQQSRMPSSA